MTRLFGGRRAWSRSVKTLIVLGAVCAVAAIGASSASASFPSPNGLNGWYVTSPVSGSVDFHPAGVTSHHTGSFDQSLISATCMSNGGVVGTFAGQSFSNPTGVPVTIFGSSANPGGTAVTCSGTMQNDFYSCSIFGCFIDGTGFSGATEGATIKIDTSPPVNVNATPAHGPNANGWYNTTTSVFFSGLDPNSGILSCGSGSPFGPGGAGQSIGTPDGASKDIIGGCRNVAGLGTGTQLIYSFDATKPTLSPSVSPTPVLRGGSATASPGASDNLSGVDSSSCDPVDTSSLGSHSVNCAATDEAGNSNSATASYSVALGFDGFLQPVDMNNTNVAKAGQTIPLKFSVSDADGPVTDLSSVSVTVQGVSCDLGDTLDQIEEYSSGDSGLQNLGGGAYQFNWKTPKTYATSCKTVQLDLGDGIDHTADFRFTK